MYSFQHQKALIWRYIYTRYWLLFFVRAKWKSTQKIKVERVTEDVSAGRYVYAAGPPTGVSSICAVLKIETTNRVHGEEKLFKCQTLTRNNTKESEKKRRAALKECSAPIVGALCSFSVWQFVDSQRLLFPAVLLSSSLVSQMQICILFPTGL